MVWCQWASYVMPPHRVTPGTQAAVAGLQPGHAVISCLCCELLVSVSVTHTHAAGCSPFVSVSSTNQKQKDVKNVNFHICLFIVSQIVNLIFNISANFPNIVQL